MQQCGNAAEKVWGVSTKDEDKGSDARSIDEMSGGLQKLTDGGVDENNDKGSQSEFGSRANNEDRTSQHPARGQPIPV